MKTNKKYSLLLALIIGLTTNLEAQNFKYGVNAGTNFSVQSETGDLYNNDDIKQGWHAGIYVNYYLTENLSLQAELNYDQKGSENANISNTYEYLSVPILAKWSLGKSNITPLNFNLYAGSYFGILAAAKRNLKNIENTETIDIKSNSESNEFGLLGGFGISYPIKSSSILLDFRIGLGLNSFDKSDNQLRNKYFGINLGYEF